MKQKILNFTFCLLCIISIIFIFSHNNEISVLIISGVNLFLTKVFVSLFPMFIINDILINLNFPYYFYLIFNSFFHKIFKTSGICAYVFIMSLISGTPTQSYILKNLVDTQKLSPEEATHYLYFTYFSNPLFLTIMLSQMFPISSVIKIIIIHYLSNVIIAFIIRNKAPSITKSNLSNIKTKLSSSLIKSINKSITTLLMILGTIVFYMLLSHIITSLIYLNALTNIIISGFFEITNGLNLLKEFSTLLKLQEIIALFIISFGGLSIHTQVKTILEDTNIKYASFLKGRIYQTLISLFLILIF